MKLKTAKRPVAALIAAAILSACSHSPKKVNPGADQSEYLIPLGSYTHHISVQVPAQNGASARDFDFSGALKMDAQMIRLIGFTPFGTTAFKLTEDRKTGQVTVENFIPQLKRFEQKIKDYYSNLRALLTTPKHPQGGDGASGIEYDPQGHLARMKRTIEGKDSEITFSKYDEHQIPTLMTVKGERFLVTIEVLGYDL